MKTRSLRLQLANGNLQGLVRLHIPAAAALAYEAAKDLRVALAPPALDGLQLSADGKPLETKVAEASVRRGRDGALDGSFLLEALPMPRTLRVAVDSGIPLPVELIAQTGLKLTLQAGPGAPVRGGLSLRPRPGVPCLVQISGAAKSTPR